MIYSRTPFTPLTALQTQAGMIDIQKKNLHREVLLVQLAIANDWPGLTREVEEICKAVQ